MFHDLVISEVRPEGDGAVALSFDVPPALQSAFSFHPGQYVTLRASINGADMRRSYSIASAPEAPLTVGVKQIPGGAFSTYAQGLRPGDRLSVMPPEGRFTCAGAQRLVLVAAGSGITPIVSMAASALARGAEVTLLYGNRRSEAIMFRDALDALKDRYLDRFTLIHILSAEPQDVDLLNGRVSGDKLRALARAGVLDLAGADGIWICGPGDMIDDVAAAAAEALPRSAIHFERFHTGGTAPQPASKAAVQAAAAGVAVEVILDGARRAFRLNGESNVLEAAARSGLDLPYSCKGGMCCTCRCKVVEGQAEMAVNYSLEPWETDAGFTLACQARPVTDRLVLDFDAS